MLFALFPSFSFLLQHLASSSFEGCSFFFNGCSPERFVPCNLLPPGEVNIALLKISFQHIFEMLLLTASQVVAFCQFRIEDLLGQTLVWHASHMPAPSELVFDDVGFDAGCLCFLYYADVGPVFPAHVKDHSKTTLVALQENSNDGDKGPRSQMHRGELG